MYIKQIIIQGFKSYKDQTVIEPFSSKHNVIVGRNGSGKSNFFAAIRFVLSDAYTQMGREERQALLHEGSGSAVMSAYVEVIFDNSDDRFPTGNKELILRRTIGLKKDEYSLDRKNATKADVMNLLESAGFSRSNPYYIVPQGRVTGLTNMKDNERLTLLKEISGTHVYEGRRSESVRIMAETDAKRGKIDELLSIINERLDELEEEKDELKQFQEHDRERRCLEYTIYNQQHQKYTRALEQQDEMRTEGIDQTDENRDRFLQGEKTLASIDEEIKTLKQQTDLIKLDMKQYDDERRQAARQRAQIELDVKTMTDGQTGAQNARARFEGDLQEVTSAIQERESQLAQMTPEYDRLKQEESHLKSQVVEGEGTRSRLYAKQGRSAKYRNKAERDAYLQKEISEVNVALATRKAVAMQTAEEIAELENNLQQGEAELIEMRTRIDNRNESMSTVSADVQKAKEARDALQDQRKELWREEAKLDTFLANTRAELEKAERFLSHMMDRETARGLAAVRRYKKQHNMAGVYGTLADLLTVNDRFKTAVEVTAGNSLFHYVVDSDKTASKLVELLNKEKAGRVTFIPLNQLRSKTANIPQANDAIPLIAKLTFGERYKKAMEQVFGKTIICPNLAVASQYARSHGVTAITPDGDRSDKKGALTGGWHDPGRSRIDAVKAVYKWRTEHETRRGRGDAIKRELETKDQEITHAVSNLQKAEQRRQQAEASYGPLQQQIRNGATEIQRNQDALESKQRAKENIDSATQELEEQLTGFQTELSSDFKKVLTREEEQLLDQVIASLPALKKQHLQVSSTRADLEAQKSNFEVELRANLRPRLDELKAQDLDSGSTSMNSRLKERQKELKQASQTVEAIDVKLRESEGELEEATDSMSQLHERRARTQSEQVEIAKLIEKFQRRMEKSMSARSRLQEQVSEAQKNIRDLGALPEEAFTKYKKLAADKAEDRLKKVNTALKKYSHVNKKAFEQYSNFTRQRETLTKRREELDTSQASIRELIDNLDQRKDEAIERTFKQVSKGFAQVFEKLVPAGRGRLIIQRRSDRAAAGDDSDEDQQQQQQQSSVENYTGVGIAVSFNSKHDEQQRIQQLSGGQKSLCALALVFAIQQCDPAPFYLFDEIDANLDAQYRTAVAALLQQISQTGQFICTTFRPEMVLVAEKCYGVAYGNKTSSIDVVDRDDALKFIEGEIAGT
ncbi:hypothetical protein FH972_024423 [Carpinus fangiana]|uniref:Structural maintenance of chromosomes protein n=1 Tax=Carpinus fangiana TaxID=176857 RepID=A0A5N6KYW8_9ROSI|nr:hypothetical protein FH972_024423 [Carpinus fangiana]